MTARLFLESYCDAVSVASLLMRCTTPEQSSEFWRRTYQAYRNAKGWEYATAVQEQVDVMLAGLDAMRLGEVP